MMVKNGNRRTCLVPGGKTSVLAAVLAVCCAAVPSCGPDQEGVGGRALEPLSLASVDPATWLEGTRVKVSGLGFVPAEVGDMKITIASDVAGQQFAVGMYLDYMGPDEAGFTVGRALIDQLPLDLGSFPASFTVTRTDGTGGSDSASLDGEIDVVSMLSPSVSTLAPANAFPGEEIEVRGAGFLLPGESAIQGASAAMPGATVLELDGKFVKDGAGGQLETKGIAIPLEVEDRTRATFVLTPDIFGLGPGSFEGTAGVRNVYQGGTDLDVQGNVIAGVKIGIGPTRLESLWPSTVHRGQEMFFQGKGFLSLDGDLGTVTFIAFTGTQTGPDGPVTHSKANPLVFVPDVVQGNDLASLVVRTIIGPDGMPAGLGSSPAVLEGTFTPHVVHGDTILEGVGLGARLEVGRQVQVVYLRFMPTFDDGIEEFGLREVSQLVKERAVQVCREDYYGISMDFRLEAPQDWVEYTTAEVMNRDPNEAGLLGLDNTFGKDVGNLRLNDLLGGYNAVSAEAGYFPYGGVFLWSFLNFSPTLSTIEEGMTAPAFDIVFGPVVPALGGKPVEPGEYPGGGRDAEIAEAVRVLGNLIGDTVSHEVGHSLGLAAIEGQFHNIGDNPGYIMDTGAFRPFEERAQLPGGNVRVFSPGNRAYLEGILPVK